jgi:molybdopterin converting factor small subunit
MAGETTDTLGAALPREMARVRDEVIPAYVACGPAGTFALMGMRRDLDMAAKALAEGDVVAMLAVYKSLKEWSL